MMSKARGGAPKRASISGYFALLLVMPAVLAGLGEDVREKKKPASRAIVMLTDGSKIMCVVELDVILIKTPRAKREMPFEKIARIDFDQKKAKATVFLKNGDRVTGDWLIDEVKGEALFGPFTVATRHLSRILNLGWAEAEGAKKNRDTPENRRWCANNLRRIAHAKKLFAAKRNLRAGAPAMFKDVRLYLDVRSGALQCPSGGSYTINPIGVDPECSVHGRAWKSR